MLRDRKAPGPRRAGRSPGEAPAHPAAAPPAGAVAEPPAPWAHPSVPWAELEGAPLVELLRAVYAAGFEAGRRARTAH